MSTVGVELHAERHLCGSAGSQRQRYACQKTKGECT